MIAADRAIPRYRVLVDEEGLKAYERLRRQTLFMGETLRGLLLNVYAFSIFGTVALIAGWVAAVAALVMVGLAIYGFSHAHKLHKQELLEAPAVESIPVA